jgi:hypothetical protein
MASTILPNYPTRSQGVENSGGREVDMVFTNCNFHACHVDLSGDHGGELFRTQALLEHRQTPKRELPPTALGPKPLNDLSRNMVDWPAPAF